MSPDLVRGSGGELYNKIRWRAVQQDPVASCTTRSGGELYNKTLVVEVSKCEYKQHGGW